jgi:hypothetical protein
VLSGASHFAYWGKSFFSSAYNKESKNWVGAAAHIDYMLDPLVMEPQIFS